MKCENAKIYMSLPAKSVEGTKDCYPLWAHSLDVYSTMKVLWEDWLDDTTRMFISSCGISRETMLYMAAMHDMGKACPLFVEHRLGLKDIFKEHLTFFEKMDEDTAKTKALMHAWISPYILAEFDGDGKKSQWLKDTDLAWAISRHHGHVTQKKTDFSYCERVIYCQNEIWLKEAMDLKSDIIEATGLDEKTIQSVAKNQNQVKNEHLVAWWLAIGLLIIADWVSSREMKDNLPSDNLKEYINQRVEKARVILHGLIGSKRDEKIVNSEIKLEDYISSLAVPGSTLEPRELQKAVSKMLDDYPNARLIVIEAPTGEGKTEAGLYACSRLSCESKGCGTFVAMPTQATANALHDRVKLWKNLFYGDDSVAIVHGGSSLIRATESYDEGDIKNLPRDSKQATLLTDTGIGTIDQTLFSVLTKKHAYLRALGIANKVILFDEIHTFDAYTNKLIEGLLWMCNKINTRVVLMSATLTSSLRESFIKAYVSRDDVDFDQDIDGDIIYPRITVVDEDGKVHTCKQSIEVRERDTTEFKINLINNGKSSREECLDKIIGKIRSNQCCGAMIVNTVAEVMKLVDLADKKIPNGDIDVFVLHGRLIANDRAEIEKEIEKTFGKHSTQDDRKMKLCIGTQILEQSLDIDFDYLATEVVTVDTLIQRVGRCRRHPRSYRHGFDNDLFVYRQPYDDPDESKNGLSALIYGEHTMNCAFKWIEANRTLDVSKNNVALYVESFHNMIMTTQGEGRIDHDIDIKKKSEEASKRMLQRGLSMSKYNTECSRDESDEDSMSPDAADIEDKPVTRFPDDAIGISVICLENSGGRLYTMDRSRMDVGSVSNGMIDLFDDPNINKPEQIKLLMGTTVKFPVYQLNIFAGIKNKHDETEKMIKNKYALSKLKSSCLIIFKINPKTKNLIANDFSSYGFCLEYKTINGTPLGVHVKKMKKG